MGIPKPSILPTDFSRLILRYVGFPTNQLQFSCVGGQRWCRNGPLRRPMRPVCKPWRPRVSYGPTQSSQARLWVLTVIADENGGMVFVPMNEALPKRPSVANQRVTSVLDRARSTCTDATLCPRCQATMTEVVRIAPLGREPGLIAYECPECAYVTSVLCTSDENNSPRAKGSCGRWSTL